MAKIETPVTNLKINRGTYDAIQANLSSIDENELIITTDKNVPIPTAVDENKVLSVNSSGDYVLATPTTYMSNPMTTQGDVIVGGTSGAPTRLAKGNAGQVLSMNSAGTLPEWSDKPTHFIKLTSTTLTEALRNEILSDNYFVILEYDTRYFYERSLNSGTKYFETLPDISSLVSNNYYSYGWRFQYYYFEISSSTSSLGVYVNNKDVPRTSSNIYSNAILSKPTSSGSNATAGQVLRADGSGNTAWGFPAGIEVLTTAPVADNTDGLKFVVLSSEPATRYNGYIYFITGSN